jgi:bifunctional non-homologous end joining protein LigD
MTAATRVADPGSWRPQSFGGRRAREIADPLIEPLWDGDRVLVHASSAGIAILDAEGVDVDALPEVAGAIADALLAEDAVVDGYLTPQAARSSEGAVLGEVKVPSSREMTAQIFIGRGRDRRRELAESEAPVVRPGDPLVLVCVDLLVIDGQPLLDVPLLERKRLLESAIDENLLVRIGAYVRPPVDPWIGSWRAQGFRALAYKAANSRYRPGEANEAWATAQIPKR